MNKAEKATTETIRTARKAAETWAFEGVGKDPSEFANRYEYARAKFVELKRAAEKAITVNKTPIEKGLSKDKMAGNAAAGEVTGEKLTLALGGDISAVKDLGDGDTAIKVSEGDQPSDLAAKVQKLERIPYQSETAEAYHALKHAKELDGLTDLTEKEPVPRFAEATKLTLTGGTVFKAELTETGSTCVIIRKAFAREIGDPVSLEAIVYVKPDGALVLATFGQAKAK